MVEPRVPRGENGGPSLNIRNLACCWYCDPITKRLRGSLAPPPRPLLPPPPPPRGGQIPTRLGRGTWTRHQLARIRGGLVLCLCLFALAYGL
jgi:hypothetical protein